MKNPSMAEVHSEIIIQTKMYISEIFGLGAIPQ